MDLPRWHPKGPFGTGDGAAMAGAAPAVRLRNELGKWVVLRCGAML